MDATGEKPWLARLPSGDASEGDERRCRLIRKVGIVDREDFSPEFL
jgi:hypothetical protein